MKVLFLDLDGVVNIFEGPGATHLKRTGVYFEEFLVKRLNRLFEEVPDLHIVMSSSWRVGDFEFAVEHLKDLGAEFCDRFIGATPVITSIRAYSMGSDCRAAEILKWVEDNNPSKWIAVDDYPYGLITKGNPLLEEHKVVLTDNRTGISEAQIDFLIDFFKDNK